MTVGADPVAGHTRATQPLLDGCEVLDGDDPAQPAAALLGTLIDREPERRRVGGGVIQDSDDLDVRASGKRKDEVAGAESWVDPTVDERALELGAEALHLVGEVRRARGIGDVVEPHGVTLPERQRHPADGAPRSQRN